MTAFSRISLAAALLSGLALPALAQTQTPAAAPATTVASTPAKTPKLHSSIHHAAATTVQPGDVKASDTKIDPKTDMKMGDVKATDTKSVAKTDAKPVQPQTLPTKTN